MSQTHFSGVLPPNVPTAAKLFIGLLSRLKSGHLQIITPEGNQMMFGDLHQPPSATLKINDWRACARIISAGDIGFAECLEADWVSTPDLTALLRLALKNEAALQRMVNGGRISTLWYRLKHWLRPNTREGSRRNIHAHYDIGNDFYQRWLDPSFTYSSAVFHGDYSISLEQAQANKYQRIIDELKLKAGDHVLEIGCGWGGFAEHAGKQGIRITGITISPAQLAIAKERVQKNNLTELVDLQLCDYRDLTGQFDAVVSIEMFEAVGERFWAEYFKTVSARLKSGGNALIQSISILERDFERYRSSTDFIQQYIFPGGMLPSPERFVEQAEKAGLATLSHYPFGRDYAETLRRWHQAWEREYESIIKLGFDDRFMRIWRMYFAYCEAGFDEGKTDVIQFLLHKA
ncbi:SAM-dependent methyltransferase [Sapientia aquatica]|nr:cyclopropane-fatty-acyl-phospholipid synthase family protein [Sapientia aquatica]